jgi:UPF0755 protein
MRDVVATIVEGKVVAHLVSIPEGLTSEQIVARLLQDNVLAGDIKQIPREGSLLPDTYNFARGITREQMVQRMQQAQQRLLHEIWEHRAPDLPLKAPDAGITRRERDRQAGGAHARRRCFRQPAQAKDEVAV